MNFAPAHKCLCTPDWLGGWGVPPHSFKDMSPPPKELMKQFYLIEDGMNEHGLAVGLTLVFSHEIPPGINAGLLLRYLLETCKSVPEAVHKMKNVPVASAQTFTLADADGEIAVIEYNNRKVTEGKGEEDGFVCATNRFHHPEMIPYNQPGVDDWFAEERYRTMYTALSDGSDKRKLY